MKIIFLGTDYYSTLALQYLIEHNATIAGVVTGTNKGSLPFSYETVYQIATKYQIPTVRVDSKKNLFESKKTLSSWKSDIGFVASFGIIIPQEIFETPTYGTLNLHPSLLPCYRGPSPMEQAIIDQKNTTGITIVRIANGVDTGNIIAQKQAEIPVDDTTLSLSRRLYPIGTQMFMDIIKQKPDGDFEETIQNNDNATLTTRYSKDDAKINWDDSADNISALVRAYYPKPLGWTTLHEIISQFSIKTPHKSSREKRVIIHSGKIENDVFIPTHIQLEGKNIIDWKTFSNGYL